MDTDFEIYKSKKFSGLLKDVVVNSEQKRAQIDILISELRSMIKTPNDAIVIVPMIKEYLDVGVKNDEQLVKLAAIVQRLSSAQTNTENNGGFGLSEEERKSLMVEAEKTITEMNKPIEIKAN
jgi:hypothetical protein